MSFVTSVGGLSGKVLHRVEPQGGPIGAASADWLASLPQNRHAAATAPAACPAAYWTRRSGLGLLSGLGVGASFALGGWWLQTGDPDKHEMAHQMCLIASVLFGGAMGYRAGSNPYVSWGQGDVIVALCA